MLFHLFYPKPTYEKFTDRPSGLTLINARGDAPVIERKLKDWNVKLSSFSRFADWREARGLEVGAVLYVWNKDGDTGAIVRVR